jgi:hypothetical protein
MKELLNKLGSGRLFLTIVCGLAFLHCAVNKTITPEAIVSILSMVFISYFQRQDRPNGGTNGQK